jgi:hypothetical protein
VSYAGPRSPCHTDDAALMRASFVLSMLQNLPEAIRPENRIPDSVRTLTVESLPIVFALWYNMPSLNSQKDAVETLDFAVRRQTTTLLEFIP